MSHEKFGPVLGTNRTSQIGQYFHWRLF